MRLLEVWTCGISPSSHQLHGVEEKRLLERYVHRNVGPNPGFCVCERQMSERCLNSQNRSIYSIQATQAPVMIDSELLYIFSVIFDFPTHDFRLEVADGCKRRKAPPDRSF